MVKLNTASSLVVWSAIGAVTVGASLVLFTTTLKTLLTPAKEVSVAVTRSESVPTLAFSGVPLKVRVAALKLSHVGSAVPSARLAE